MIKRKFIKKTNVNQKDLLANYKKFLLLSNHKIPNYKQSFFSDNIVYVNNFDIFSINLAKYYLSFFVNLHRNQKKKLSLYNLSLT